MKKNLGEFYDKTSDFQQAQFDYLTTLIKQHIPLDEIKTLIDIGSGTGKRTKDCFDIFPKLSQITAVEPDPDMHAQAIAHHHDPRINYLQKAASHIDQIGSMNKAFDMVLSHWVMHWIKEKDTLFHDIDYVIHDHKKSYLAIATCESLPRILQDVDTYMRIELGISPAGENPFYYYDKNQWEQLLNKNGWTPIIIDNFSVDHQVADSKTYLEHWFTASTAKFTYNRNLTEIKDQSQEELLFFMEQKYGIDGQEKALKFKEDVIFILAEK